MLQDVCNQYAKTHVPIGSSPRRASAPWKSRLIGGLRRLKTSAQLVFTMTRAPARLNRRRLKTAANTLALQMFFPGYQARPEARACGLKNRARRYLRAVPGDLPKTRCFDLRVKRAEILKEVVANLARQS